jgi:glycosyltransferase involved in cell wall biosynthesis
MMSGMLSLVIPVYRNQANLPRLFQALDGLAPRLPGGFEVVFVVDGSPDQSLDIIRRHVPSWPVRAQVIELSRNFGSFAAIAAGLQHAEGSFMAVMAADLQEPPELVLEFHRLLSSGEADVVLGYRSRRTDPLWSRALSGMFWTVYRRMVSSEMPAGGVDVFGCTSAVRDHLVSLTESNTNLVALLLWVGFRRAFVPYERQARLEGESGWTFGRKVRYALDSIFNFTDLPVRALLWLGTIGTTLALVAGITVFVGWWMERIPVLGYTPLMLVVAFFGGLTALGLGIVGQYLWLTLQNARRRPNYIVRSAQTTPGKADQGRTSDRNVS